MGGRGTGGKGSTCLRSQVSPRGPGVPVCRSVPPSSGVDDGRQVPERWGWGVGRWKYVGPDTHYVICVLIVNNTEVKYLCPVTCLGICPSCCYLSSFIP